MSGGRITPDEELGHLGRLLKRWANAQRFPPSQRQMAAEVGVSQQSMSDWMRGRYVRALKPAQVKALAKMMGRPNDLTEVLEAVLADAGLKD